MGYDGFELDDVQVELLSWIMTYKNIYEMSSEDRPDSETISNDRKLDLYLEDLQRKRKK